MPPGPNSPSLPAAHTTVIPFFQANSTALAIGSKSAGATGLLPIERLSTRMLYCCLCATAHSTPAITEEARPWPVPSRTFTPMMFGLRRDAAELHVGEAAVFERQGGGAVAGDEAGDEGAVAGVVVRRASAC